MDIGSLHLKNIYWSLFAIVSVAVAIAVTLHFVLKVMPSNYLIPAYGQSLDDLVGETLQEQSYRAELMDFINSRTIMMTCMQC